MADAAREWTDRRLLEMETHLRKIYKQAQAELTQKWNDYMARGESRLNNLYAFYLSAPPDQKAAALQAYQDAMQSYTLKNKWYRDMVDETTLRLANVNQIAASYINGQIPEIYGKNYNFIEPDALATGIRWTLRDEYTIRRLVEETFPERQVNYAKDMLWNKRQINGSVLQGILQGESIPKIAKRLLPIVDRNKAAAIRTARTTVTGAENRGRLDRYHDYESEGVVMTKIWLATPDGRTRDWHISMDGQEVGVNEDFIDGHGNELSYPGDPDGEPETVYNCFVADTGVMTNSEILRSYRHDYEGDLFTIKTAGGVEFTCTPNHPILTLRGWIPAHALHNGDDILVALRIDSRIFGFDPYIKHVFPRFDAVHKFGEKCSREWATHLNVDFHGDTPTSDVEIITHKGFLRSNRDSSRCKGVNKLLFKSTNMTFPYKRTFMEHLRRIWFSSFSVICGRCKTLAFFGRSLAHAKIHGLRPIAWGNSGCFKSIIDNRSRYSKILSECLNGFSGIVCADKIVSIDINFSHCDVFNLQSENGYYYVNSRISQNCQENNDIMAIVQNCRCSMRSHITGIRQSDGSVKKITYSGDTPTMHARQISQEKARRADNE